MPYNIEEFILNKYLTYISINKPDFGINLLHIILLDIFQVLIKLLKSWYLGKQYWYVRFAFKTF